MTFNCLSSQTAQPRFKKFAQTLHLPFSDHILGPHSDLGRVPPLPLALGPTRSSNLMRVLS